MRNCWYACTSSGDWVSSTSQLDAFDEISGFIDHLVVTPDTYHIVDYKTNDIDAVEAKGEYYRTQLEAYTVALHQQDADRDVVGTLYFTTPETPHRVEWSAGELDALEDELVRKINGELPPIEMDADR